MHVPLLKSTAVGSLSTIIEHDSSHEQLVKLQAGI